MFYESLSCLFGFIIAGWIFFKIRKDKSLSIYVNSVSFAVFVMTVFYGISTVWAVDSGMALFGFLKFMPAFLFLIAVMQEENSIEEIKWFLPYFAAGLTVISVICMCIPILKNSFSVAGRLAGFFQYPNTFALFLLVAELILIARKELKKKDVLVLLILLGGLLYTGSRAVFVLAVFSNALLALLQKNKRKRVVFLLIVGGIAATLIIYSTFVGDADVLSRFARLSLNESTFAGRLLYYQDAIPLVFQHPFGLGYMGHYYMQQSIQTGLYSVLYIHNDFLQVLLDIGWVPFVCLIFAIGKSLFSKALSCQNKIILMVMVFHSLFDFNLQFVSMFWLMLLFMDVSAGKKYVWNNKLIAVRVVCISMMGLCVFGGIVSGLVQLGKNEVVHQIYPWHTQNEIQRLTKAEDVEEMNEIADGIIERNKYVSVAYSAKARYAYSIGDFGSLIQYKNLLFEQATFQYEEYEEYCYMLMNGIYLYQQAGDMESARVCMDELQMVQERLEKAEDKLSNLGRIIKDQPQTELPEDIVEYINGGVRAN